MNRSEAFSEARKLMNYYGLGHWSLQFDRALNRRGRCNYRLRTISLSGPFVDHNDWNRVKFTVLHEIAHALTPGHKHDNVWKRKCLEIGGNGATCSDTLAETIVVPYRYEGFCDCLGSKVSKKHKARRMTHNMKYGICIKCRSRVTWYDNTARDYVRA